MLSWDLEEEGKDMLFPIRGMTKVDEEIVDLRTIGKRIEIVADDDHVPVLVCGLDVFPFETLVSFRYLADDDDIEDVLGHETIFFSVFFREGKAFQGKEGIQLCLCGKDEDFGIIGLFQDGIPRDDMAVRGRRGRGILDFLSSFLLDGFLPVIRNDGFFIDFGVGEGKGNQFHVSEILAVAPLRAGREEQGGKEKEISSFGHGTILNYWHRKL